MKDAARSCWNTIGVAGDRSCTELRTYIHCNNCPVFSAGGRALLERNPTAGQIDEWTANLAMEKSTEKRSEKAAYIFRVGTEWLGIPADLFVEIVEMRPIRRIPHRHNNVLTGVMSIRGEIHLCFSMADLLGIDAGVVPAESKAVPRVCVVRKSSFVWGFPVAEMLGLHRFSESDIEQAPMSIAKAVPRFTSGVLTAGNRKIGLLDDELLFHALEKYIA